MPSLTRPALLSTLLLALLTQGTQAATVTRTSGYQYEAATGLLAKYLIVLSADAVNAVGDHTEVEIRIRADSMALENQGKPGQRIIRR